MNLKRPFETCEAHVALELVRGRWKLLILRSLRRGPHRTGELVRALSGVAKNRLNDNLRQLERSGIIRKKTFSGRVPRVEYGLTGLGRSLCPIIDALHEWGVKNKRRFLGPS